MRFLSSGFIVASSRLVSKLGIIRSFAVGKELGQLAKLGDGLFAETVELFFERGIALGQSRIVDAFGFDQDFLLLTRDLLQLVALALHFALHAAHARSHGRALRVLQRRYHLRHLIEQLPGHLPRAFDIALHRVFCESLRAPEHVVKAETLHGFGVHKIVRHLLRQLRQRLLQGRQGFRQLGDLLHDRVEVLVAALSFSRDSIRRSWLRAKSCAVEANSWAFIRLPISSDKKRHALQLGGDLVARS